MAVTKTKPVWSGGWRRWWGAVAIGAAVLVTSPVSVWGQGAKPDAAALAEASRLAEEATKLSGEGKHDAAISLAERALTMTEQALGPEDPRVAQALGEVAALYHRKGDAVNDAAEAHLCAVAAERLHRRAISIREKANGLEHPTVAMSLQSLARLHYDRGEYDQAEPLYKRVLAIWQKVLRPEHPLVATSFTNLGDVYRMKRDYTRAEPLYQQALGIWEKALGPEHPNLVAALNGLALIHDDNREYAKAESLYQRALSIREKAFGPEHPDVAASLNNLAGVYQQKGEYATAEKLHNRALSIREKALGPEHPDVATSLNNLAGLYQHQKVFTKAEGFHRRALSIRTKALGPEHPDVAASLNNLAGLYQQKGDLDRPVQLHRQALAIRKKALGAEHPDVATSLNNLAGLYRLKKEYTTAEKLYRQALSIREKALGPEHPQVIESLLGLADLYVKRKDHAGAESIYRMALSVSEKAQGYSHPEMARQLGRLAAVHEARRDHRSAALLYRLQLDIEQKALTHTVLQALATGDTPWAIRKLKHAAATEEHDVLLKLGSEEHKRAYMATLRGTTDAGISVHVQFAPNDPDAMQIALTTVLRRKGRVLDAMIDSLALMRRYRLFSGDSQRWFDWLGALRTQYTTLVWRGPESMSMSVKRYRAKLEGLENEIRNAEAELTSHVAHLQNKLEPITPDQVRLAIPRGAVLVELFRYRPVDPRRAGLWGEPRYVAYVIHRRGEPSFVDLGEAAPIDNAARKLRAALSNPNLTRDPTAAARALDAQVMQPIRALLGKSRHIFLSPDGALNLIPFGALVDEHGAYLVEQYLFTYLTSGRDLVRVRASNSSQQGPVVLADAAFDAGAPKNLAEEEATHRGLRSVDMSLVRFSPLPSTAEEARAIQKRLPDAQILLGAQATEESLKAVQRPRVLHIATHGFFLPEQDDVVDYPAVPGGAEPSESTSDGGKAGAVMKWENPLLRSGLGLAGANARESGYNNDGILTALEVANLDLDGTVLIPYASPRKSASGRR